MSDHWDLADIRAAAAAMREFERRCDEILALLGVKRSLSPNERAEVERLYRSLKDDLKRAEKANPVAGDRRPMSRAEIVFYDAAVQHAAKALRPATNSDPTSWLGPVQDARMEFSYHLRGLAKIASRG